MSDKRPFIVIEGPDGAGKGTVFNKITKRFEAEGIEYGNFDFPRYGEPSASLVESYLRNEFGGATELSPELASTFFAVDRALAAPSIKETLAIGRLAISNRFTGSNLAHQGAKIADQERRREYFTWNEDLEFNRFEVPRPDLNITLLLPAAIAQERVLMKAKREYTDEALDGHEADLDYLERTVNVYSELCEIFPDWFTPIDCIDNGRELTVDEVTNKVWEQIEGVL